MGQSNYNVKLHLETFFILRFLISLLGLTSISLGKSVLSGHFSSMIGKLVKPSSSTNPFNILPRSPQSSLALTAAKSVCWFVSLKAKCSKQSLTIGLFEIAATQLLLRKQLNEYKPPLELYTSEHRILDTYFFFA